MRKQQIKFIMMSTMCGIFFLATYFLLPPHLVNDGDMMLPLAMALIYLLIIFLIKRFTNSNMEEIDELLKTKKLSHLKTIIFGAHPPQTKDLENEKNERT